MISSILLIVALVIIALCAGISALRGFSKSGLRCATLLISALAAVITCVILKAQLPDAQEFVVWLEANLDSISQILGDDAGELLASVKELSSVSPTLVELVLQLLGALLAPIVCLLLFFVYSFITFIIYFIVKLILRGPMKLLNKAVPLSRLCAAGVGAIEGIIIVTMLFLPVSSYMSVVEPAVSGLVEQGVMDAEDPDTQTVLDVVEEIDQAPAMQIHRVLGGKPLANSLMSVKVAGEKVIIEEELDSVLALLMSITELGETEMQNYGQREADLIRAIGESFKDSKLLAPIVGDILYGATDAWLNGEDFLGMEKPNMGEASELFGPFVDALLEILHDDAKTPDLLQNDIQTLADVIGILVENEVMANIENTEALLATLGGDGVVESMIETLGANESTKRLIPEVTNLGVRAIGQVLNIPQDVESVYGDFMDDVADTLNHIATMPESQRVEELSERLSSAFDDAGVAIDASILDFYSASMIHDLVDNNSGEVTSEDVQAFFLIYAENALEDSPSASANYPRVEVLSNNGAVTNIMSSSIYGKMSAAQLRQTGAANIANLSKNLSKLDANSASFKEQAKSMVMDTFTGLLGADHPALNTLEKVDITAPISNESIQNMASMRSLDSMKSTTKVITLQDLLIDCKAVAGRLNAESIKKEAEAINAIFSAAGQLMDKLGGSGDFDLAQVAGSLGTILDSMKNTDSFGQDKTANLFTAVLQSKTVRESAGLDMQTATQMANKATEGNGSYSQTMGTVAGSMGLADKLNKGDEITDEELVELIKNLNPQTAGMLELYMTGKRMEQFGVPAEQSQVSSDLICAIFSYMAREDLEDYDAEAKGLNQVLQIAMSAKSSDKDKMFSSSKGANDGRLPTADEVVASLMESKAINYALVDVLTDGNKVTITDPFDLAEDLKDDKEDYDLIQKAIKNHQSKHPEIDDLAYEALAGVFEVEIK